jgi:hypothetical protein
MPLVYLALGIVGILCLIALVVTVKWYTDTAAGKASLALGGLVAVGNILENSGGLPRRGRLPSLRRGR